MKNATYMCVRAYISRKDQKRLWKVEKKYAYQRESLFLSKSRKVSKELVDELTNEKIVLGLSTRARRAIALYIIERDLNCETRSSSFPLYGIKESTFVLSLSLSRFFSHLS